MNSVKIFIDMERIKNINSGLGSVCMQLGNKLSEKKKHNMVIDLLVGKKYKNFWGKSFNYITYNIWHKIFPVNFKRYDIWHCLHQDSSFLPFYKSTKLILTIHDLNYFFKYTGKKRAKYLKRLQYKVNEAKVITVTSRYTESVVKENLYCSDKIIKLIYNGHSLKTFTNSTCIIHSQYSEYFFSIGVLTSKKNFHTLIPMMKNFPNINLVIAGQKDTSYAKQMLKVITENNLESRVHMIGCINEEEKYCLYKNCLAFVFPSLSEGFGIPVIEAMSLGKPTFLSKKTCLPEIGGTEAFYWDNFNPDSMAKTITEGLKSYKEDVYKKDRIIQWSNNFSYEKTATEFLNLYESI